jgi:hypothetical protein
MRKGTCSTSVLARDVIRSAISSSFFDHLICAPAAE